MDFHGSGKHADSVETSEFCDNALLSLTDPGPAPCTRHGLSGEANMQIHMQIHVLETVATQ